jgi:hypothetical protein
MSIIGDTLEHANLGTQIKIKELKILISIK